MTIRVGLVTTWGTACGIAEHSAVLKQSVERLDPLVELVPMPEALDPDALEGSLAVMDLLHLNYHAALHSRWTPERIARVQSLGIPVTVTYHDTGVPNSEQCQRIVDAADATIVHEPFDDLPAHKAVYIRMGVPDWPDTSIRQLRFRQRPVLGTVGFPFPWKNYDELCRVTAAAGWALQLIAPNHTASDKMRWESFNQHVEVYDFVNRREAVELLAGCDATAFCYTCANTGQSGAILQGIAARKPVIAFSSAICRQFRALYMDRLGRDTIRWADSFDHVREMLQTIQPARFDAGIVALAEQESWYRVAGRYLGIWRSLRT